MEDTIKLHFKEEEMLYFISLLLELREGSKFMHNTFGETPLEISFEGNCHNVQKALFDRLNESSRKFNFGLMSDKEMGPKYKET